MRKLKSWGHFYVGDEVRFLGHGRRGCGKIVQFDRCGPEKVWVIVAGDGWTVSVGPEDIELVSLLDRLAREAG